MLMLELLLLLLLLLLWLLLLRLTLIDAIESLGRTSSASRRALIAASLAAHTGIAALLARGRRAAISADAVHLAQTRADAAQRVAVRAASKRIHWPRRGRGEGGAVGMRLLLLLLLQMPIKRDHRWHYQISALRQQATRDQLCRIKSTG